MDIFLYFYVGQIVFAVASTILLFAEYKIKKEEYGTGTIFLLVFMLGIIPFVGVCIAGALVADVINRLKNKNHIKEDICMGIPQTGKTVASIKCPKISEKQKDLTFGTDGRGEGYRFVKPSTEDIKSNVRYMDAETVKKIVCEAIDNIPDYAGIEDCYTEHSFGDSEAWIKIHISVKEETEDNTIDFHNIAHNAFDTDMGVIS